ncbi:MAG: enoyl-ACP reductase FabV [Taibaiella sp.]|jgi:enoyl-[acyl-carrier protein] reductase/trans-2-enoyl-CoA reductase (NAD+)
MIIEPKIRGFICTTAHPAGCEKNVLEQIEYVKAQGHFAGAKNVLVIGASTGYGLASRIAAAFGAGAKTLGVFYERPSDQKRTASAGWYNTAAFEKFALDAGLYAKSINGDAFSDEIKQQTAEIIRKDLGQVDLIIYSLASPRRTDPTTGEVFSSVLKPVGQAYTNKTVDPFTGIVKEVTLEPATADEVAHTIAVMGGDDWQRWIEFLAKENLLAQGIKTVAYSYIGPKLTYAIYKDGSIGQAKAHLQKTAKKLTHELSKLNGEAIVSVNKALVTQASAAIPVVPLYISLLFKIMKQHGTHEGCIEQIVRLYQTYLYAPQPLPRDNEGLIRIDDLEMQPEIQKEIFSLWDNVNSDNIENLTDIEGYRQEFRKLFGFDMENIDYSQSVDPDVKIPSL